MRALIATAPVPSHRVRKRHVEQAIVGRQQLREQSREFGAVMRVEIVETGSGARAAAPAFRTATPPSTERRRSSARLRATTRSPSAVPDARSRAAGSTRLRGRRARVLALRIVFARSERRHRRRGPHLPVRMRTRSSPSLRPCSRRSAPTRARCAESRRLGAPQVDDAGEFARRTATRASRRGAPNSTAPDTVRVIGLRPATADRYCRSDAPTSSSAGKSLSNANAPLVVGIHIAAGSRVARTEIAVGLANDSTPPRARCSSLPCHGRFARAGRNDHPVAGQWIVAPFSHRWISRHRAIRRRTHAAYVPNALPVCAPMRFSTRVDHARSSTNATTLPPNPAPVMRAP